MKKNVLALSIAAMIGGLGFAGAASAGVISASSVAHASQAGIPVATQFAVNLGGVGHQLVVPYFTAQEGNMTVLHVVNTDTKNGKALKVRFRGGANSDDILDLQVLMSPGDVWTAAVTKGADGVASLVTADNTCTYPKLTKGVAQSFVTGRLNPALTGDALANQTREGYVEVFNMADIPESLTTGSLYSTIKHKNGVAACDGATLDKYLLTNYTSEVDAKAAGFAAPSTGLMGDWYVMNPTTTTVFSGAATALTAVDASGAAGLGNFVFFPQLANSVSSPENFTSDPALVTTPLATKNAAGSGSSGTTVVTAAYYDLPDLSTPYLNAASSVNAQTQAAQLTSQLAVKTVTNEYARDPSISAQTDWVFSMPTRRYSVAMNYATGKRVYSQVGNNGVAVGGSAAPQYFSDDNTTISGGKICVKTDKQEFWDREETVLSSGAVFSPSQLTTFQLCGEVSVLSFSTTSPLGASIARESTTAGYTNGWGVVNTANNGLGLPVLGASFIKLTNQQTNINYGLTFPHRFSK